MNWFKLLTKSGRQSLVRDMLKESVTADAVADYAVRGVNALLGRVNDKEKLGAVALNVEQGAKLLATVSAAIKDGEVTSEEALAVMGGVGDLVGAVVTQEQIDALVEKVVEQVP